MDNVTSPGGHQANLAGVFSLAEIPGGLASFPLRILGHLTTEAKTQDVNLLSHDFPDS